jgi:hypothetical protein
VPKAEARWNQNRCNSQGPLDVPTDADVLRSARRSAEAGAGRHRREGGERSIDKEGGTDQQRGDRSGAIAIGAGGERQEGAAEIVAAGVPAVISEGGRLHGKRAKEKRDGTSRRQQHARTIVGGAKQEREKCRRQERGTDPTEAVCRRHAEGASDATKLMKTLPIRLRTTRFRGRPTASVLPAREQLSKKARKRVGKHRLWV